MKRYVTSTLALLVLMVGCEQPSSEFPDVESTVMARVATVAAALPTPTPVVIREQGSEADIESVVEEAVQATITEMPAVPAQPNIVFQPTHAEKPIRRIVFKRIEQRAKVLKAGPV